jgi:hypothetical protein
MNPIDSSSRRRSARKHPEDRRPEKTRSPLMELERPSRQSRKPRDRAAAAHDSSPSVPPDDRKSGRDHSRDRKRRDRSRSRSPEDIRGRRKRHRPRSRSPERSRHGRRRRGGRQRYRDRRSGSSYSEDPRADEAPSGTGVVSDDEDLPAKRAAASDARGKKQAVRSPSTHDDTVGHFRGGSGTIIADRYRILKEVGLGTFGRVVECLDLKQGNTGRAPGRRRQYRESESRHVAIKIVSVFCLFGLFLRRNYCL